jgi:hypothetical protein
MMSLPRNVRVDYSIAKIAISLRNPGKKNRQNFAIVLRKFCNIIVDAIFAIILRNIGKIWRFSSDIFYGCTSHHWHFQKLLENLIYTNMKTDLANN